MADYDYIVQHSPNQSSRGYYGYGPTPTGITIHWWGRMGQDHDDVADYLCRDGGNSSAHEVISDGRVTHLIDFDQASWHSGSDEGNGTRIGLECRPEMTPGDLETVAQRCADIEIQLGRSMYYDGHRDWSATTCPGTWYDQLDWIISRVNEIKDPDSTPSTKGGAMLTNTVLPTGEGRHDITIGGKNGASSDIVQDLFYTLVSGYDGLSDVEVHFVMADSLDLPKYGTAESGDSADIADLSGDQSAYWKVPSGCVGVSFTYTCKSDASRPVVYAEVQGY